MKDKIIVITGASSGLGAEVALLSAELGAIPILLARSLDKLKEISAKINGKHDLFQLDVTSVEEVNQVMNKIIEKYQKIDILINNAGFGSFDYFLNASIDTYERMMDVNYMGMVRCTKAVIPHMLQRKSGHIINVASVAGKLATPKSAGYSATKFAVIGFSNSIRQELREKGIVVSTFNPGPIDTPFFDIADPSGHYKKNIKGLMLTPQKAASKMIQLMKQQRTEMVLPFLAKIGVQLQCIFPKTFDRLLGNALDKK